MATRFKSVSLALLLGSAGNIASLYASSIDNLSIQNIQQQKSICSGVVTDDQGMPVIGASILIKGTTNGTVTDIDGNFNLAEAKKGDILVISYIGMNSKEIKYAGAPIKVTLKEDTHNLNEVVVTGYGGQQKRGTLTTAISKMDNKVLDNAAFGNVGQALQGTVSGLQVVNTSGTPGASPTITLRGGASITSTSSALVIVDGVVRDLSEISSDDIESIEVLKDAASTAIYGARANGGVILVTTKKGKAGRTNINYKTKMGINFKRNDYEYLNAHDYIYYNRLGYKRYAESTGASLSGVDNMRGYSGYGAEIDEYGAWFAPMFDCIYDSDIDTYGVYGKKTTRDELRQNGWQLMDDPAHEGQQLWYRDYGGQVMNAAFRNKTLTQDHHVSVTGGNDVSTFAASLGYYGEDGIVKSTSYKRFTGQINGSYKIKPNFNVKAGASLMWSKQPTLYVDAQYLYSRTLMLPPTWNPYKEDGSPAPGWTWTDGNMLYWKDVYTNENSYRTETFNAGFDWDIIPKKLKFTVNGSVFYTLYQNEDFNKSYYQDTKPSDINTTRNADATMTKDNQIQLNAMLNYTDQFAGKHNIDAMVGTEYYDYSYFTLFGSTKNSPTDDIPTLNAGAEPVSVSSSKTGHRIESLFGRVNYNYMEKYLLSLTMRYDGISKLKDHRWGAFPGISAGWNVTQEDFWKNSKISKVISNLKPRVSYGVNGNVNGIGDYYIYGKYTLYSPNTYKNQSGYWNSTLKNTKLRWEQSKTFEGGLDISFFDNRLAFILDYYVRNTSNLITSVNLPAYTGFSSITTNLGKLRNQGFEMEMRANIINKHGFRWDVTANLSTVKNTILELPTSDKPNNYMGGVEVAAGKVDANGVTPTKWIGGYGEGGRLDELYGYHQQFIFKNWDEVKQYANNRIDEIGKTYGPGMADQLVPGTDKTYAETEGWKALAPGDVCWEDINGDGVINSLDRKVLGHSMPTVTGGFSTTVAYKGLSLYARFDYALGHKIWNERKAASMAQGQGEFNNITEVKKMWSEDNPNSDYPMFTYADQLNKRNIFRDNYGDELSSRFLENGNYLALREITLSYSLPKALVSPIGMQGASVYVTGQNLFYITKYTGSMPEPRSGGVDYGTYPTPKTLLFGISLTF